MEKITLEEFNALLARFEWDKLSLWSCGSGNKIFVHAWIEGKGSRSIAMIEHKINMKTCELVTFYYRDNT